MNKGVKINYILNLINTGSQLLVPLICFPYASRILMPEGIGKVSFFNSIVEYVLLLINIGIPMYAVREIAKVRDNKQLRDKTAMEVLSLHFLLTVIGYLAIFVICFVVPQIKSDAILFLVLSLCILLNTIGCEWFYQGIEDFLYVTVRGIATKALSVVFLFVFVKTQYDIVYYALFTIIGGYGGFLFNFVKLIKHIDFSSLKLLNINPFRHFVPCLGTFAFSVITTAYLLLNPTILGFMANMTDVGYFTAATKLMFWGIRLTSCLGMVMMPHLSNMLANNRYEEFKNLSQKAYDFVLYVTLPLTSLLWFSSEAATYLLCGKDFAPAIITAKIVAPIVFFTGISNVIGYQILYPLGHLNIVIKATFVGLIIDLVLNFILIPVFSYNGTALAYLLAEVGTMIVIISLSNKKLPIKLFDKRYIKIVIALVFSILTLSFLSLFSFSHLSLLIINCIFGLGVYFVTTILLGVDIARSILSKLK